MKWYNKHKTKMLNLDAVNGYVFVSAASYIYEYPTAEDVNDYKIHGDKLELIIGGNPYIFRGEEALEIFNLLTNEGKELLKG